MKQYIHSRLYIFIVLSLFASGICPDTKAKTDLIIYSYDRPMQLYALLESIEYFVSGLDKVFVIFRTSSDDFAQAYQIVQHSFIKMHFIKQSSESDDLKALTQQCLVKSSSRYILFGVDDIIVKDSINLNECITALEDYNAHGFFFRLGKNLDYCYAMNCAQPLPPLNGASKDIYSWQFNQAQYDWNYPNNLDLTLYRTSDFINLINSLDYKTPNSLESQLMQHVDYTQHGLCYQSSKIVNFPLNIVQKDFPNNCDNKYTTAHLLELFNNGLKIDIEPIYQLPNKSAHITGDSLITFIPREAQNEKLIVIVTPSYNNKEWWEWNLASLIKQNYSNYYIIITDDCSTDGTGHAIEQYITENHLEAKVKLICNKERRGALHNLYTMIHSCPNQAIIITVDGDDALPNPYVLKKINRIYSTQDVWLTYGQFVEHPSGIKGWCSAIPSNIVQNNAFREYPDLPSHLRTFYAWLFKLIKLEDMLYYGEFYRMTWDYVMMLPMIEMAGNHHLCIQDQIMYVYNNANAISDHKISRQLQAHLAQIVRAKKRYQPLSAKQEDFAQDLNNEKADMILFAQDCNPDLLDQCIFSINSKIKGIGTIFVLYSADSNIIQKYYAFEKKYRNIVMLQINQNKDNFKELLTATYFNLLNSDYLIFGLANCIVEQSIDISKCIQALEQTHAYAFSLKLSKEDPAQPIPLRMPLLEIQDDICAWNYATGNEMWSCANNLDMTLYRKDTPSLFTILNDPGYWMYSEIHLLGWWAHEGNLDKVGLCFNSPKIRQLTV